MRFEIEMIGEKRLIANMRKSAVQAQNVKPALNVMADYMMFVTNKRFELQGPGWRALTYEHSRFKRSKAYDPRILHMRRSHPLLSSVTKRGSRHQILQIEGTTLVFGTRVPYAAAHQHGFRGAGIPARPFLVINKFDRTNLSNLLADHLMRPFYGDALPPAYPGANVARGPGGRFVSRRR
jgi:phage gpG-like protein